MRFKQEGYLNINAKQACKVSPLNLRAKRNIKFPKRIANTTDKGFRAPSSKRVLYLPQKPIRKREAIIRLILQKALFLLPRIKIKVNATVRSSVVNLSI